MRKLLLCAVCLLLVFPVVANATSISADWTGTRSTTVGGVTATDGWSGTGNYGFKISWDITYNDPYFTYEYTITGATDVLSKGLSHWILEVTEPSNADDFLNVSPYFSVNNDGSEESPKQWDTSGTKNPNPYMPASGIYGLKWDVRDSDNEFTYVVSFDTVKDPVWGDFYAKDGSEGAPNNKIWATAYNVRFGTNPEDIIADGGSPNFMNWIATPNGGGDWPPFNVPEPATMLLIGSGLLGIAVSGKKRFKRRNG